MGIAATIENPQKPDDAGLNDLVALVADGMKRVNSTILSRTGSDVAMIPEVANHLIASGGKRLRPILTSPARNSAATRTKPARTGT